MRQRCKILLKARAAAAWTARLATLGASIVVLQNEAAARAQQPAQVRAAQAIAEEAYLYGFPMIVNYKVMYDYTIDRASRQFRRRSTRSPMTRTSLRPKTR